MVFLSGQGCLTQIILEVVGRVKIVSGSHVQREKVVLPATREIDAWQEEQAFSYRISSNSTSGTE